jgi:hypothetical protein
VCFCWFQNTEDSAIKFKVFNILELLPVDVLTNVYEFVIGYVFFEMGEMDMPQFSFGIWKIKFTSFKSVSFHLAKFCLFSNSLMGRFLG